MAFSKARLRKAGLRVRCVRCGHEERHYFEVRLRDKFSTCCAARMVPAWHLRARKGRVRYPKLYARALDLKHSEIKRLGPV